MYAKEATARIKINKLLDETGWRFFADGDWAFRTEKKIQATLARVWGKDGDNTKLDDAPTLSSLGTGLPKSGSQYQLNRASNK